VNEDEGQLFVHPLGLGKGSLGLGHPDEGVVETCYRVPMQACTNVNQSLTCTTTAA